MSKYEYRGEVHIYWDQGQIDDTVNSINNLSKVLQKTNPKKESWQSSGKKRKPKIK